MSQGLFALGNHSSTAGAQGLCLAVTQVSYQYWMITQRNSSVTQTGLSKGELQAEVTPAATETLSGVPCLSSEISKGTFGIIDDHYRPSM